MSRSQANAREISRELSGAVEHAGEQRDRPPPRKNHEVWCSDIDWVLNIAASELGACGVLGSIEAVLKLGGHPGGIPATDLTDYDAGLSKWRDDVESPSGKWRRLAPVWFSLTTDTQAVLMAHYTIPRAIRGNEWERARGSMDKFVNSAVNLADDETRVKLIRFLTGEKTKGKKDAIAAAVRRVEPMVREAHGNWYATKEALGKEPLAVYIRMRDAGQLEDRLTLEARVEARLASAK